MGRGCLWIPVHESVSVCSNDMQRHCLHWTLLQPSLKIVFGCSFCPKSIFLFFFFLASLLTAAAQNCSDFCKRRKLPCFELKILLYRVNWKKITWPANTWIFPRHYNKSLSKLKMGPKKAFQKTKWVPSQRLAITDLSGQCLKTVISLFSLFML